MKNILITIPALLLFGCATTEKFNNNLAEQNIAIVKNTTYDPIFSIKANETIVKKINGQIVEEKSSYQLPSGENSLVVRCNYYETSLSVFFGTRTIKAKLIKGHTYKLIPLLARKKSSGELICYSQLKDITEM